MTSNLAVILSMLCLIVACGGGDGPSGQVGQSINGRTDASGPKGTGTNRHPLAVQASGVIAGTLDLVESSTCHAVGWARNSISTEPVEVLIYRDGSNKSGVLIGTQVANTPRPDLPFQDKNHAFDISFLIGSGIEDGKIHTISAYGIDENGNAQLLNLSGKSLRCGVLNTDVKAYGATGDGITDDSDAIQRAIDDTFPGGVVNVPAGTYMLGKPHGPMVTYSAAQMAQSGIAGEYYALDLRGSITLRGEGRSSILKLMPTRLGILHIRDSIITVVERLVLDGNASKRYLRNPETGFSFDWPQGNIVSGLILAGSNVRGPIVRDCEIRNGLEDGVGALPGPEFTVENCYIHDNGAYSIDGSSRGGGVGISMNGGSHNKAFHNVLARNTHGVVIGFGPTNHQVEDNALIGNFCGLWVGSGLSNDSVQPGSGFLIADNVVEKSGACYGVAVIGKESGTLIDNEIINNGGAIGVYFGDQPDSRNISRNWLVTQNLIANTSADGHQALGVLIDGNSQLVSLNSNQIRNNGSSMAEQLSLRASNSVNADWQNVNNVSYAVGTPSTRTPTIAAVLHAATLQSGSLAPGEVVLIRGTDLGPLNQVAGQITSYGRLQKRVADVRVLFDGVPAPLVTVSSTEIKTIVPYYTYWKDTVNIEVEFLGTKSQSKRFDMAETNPGIVLNSIFNQDGSLNSSSNPARIGSVVNFSAIGEGQTQPAGVDGQLIKMDSPPKPRANVLVRFGSQLASVVEAAEAPGLPAGTLRVAVRVPSIPSSLTSAPVTLSVGGRVSSTVNAPQIYFSASLPDCLFNWAETNYGDLFAPHSVSSTLSPYYYRFYSGTNSYLGTSDSDGMVYYLGSDGNLQNVGSQSQWYTTAGCR